MIMENANATWRRFAWAYDVIAVTGSAASTYPIILQHNPYQGSTKELGSRFCPAQNVPIPAIWYII